jgi:hypothetical protein
MTKIVICDHMNNTYLTGTCAFSSKKKEIKKIKLVIRLEIQF